MSNEKPEGEPTRERIIKELLTEMERETGDVESTREDFLVSLDYTSRYMKVLQSEEFWNEVNKGEFSVKTKWREDGHGDNILDYVEIRDKDGKILLMEDFKAITEWSEEHRKLALPRQE